MPCYDPDHGPGACWENPLSEKVNELTRLLCSACSQMEVTQTLIPSDVYEWWKKHKAFDESKCE